MLRRSVNLSWHMVSKMNTPACKNVTFRFYHITCRTRNSLISDSIINNHVQRNIIGTYSVRYGSFFNWKSDTYELPKDLLQHIPDPPPEHPVTSIFNKFVEYHANGEPTFNSIGLGGFWPPGIVQRLLEWLHISLELPWWSTIMICTLLVRIVVFPLILRTQRSSAKLQNIMPQITELQKEATEARESGNTLEAALKSQEVVDLIKTSGFKVSHLAMGPIIQGSILFCFFMALRGMANAPVESMKQGGLWWFTDLTVADPTYLLPLATCLTLLVTLELGADTGKLPVSSFWIKYGFRIMPFVIFFPISGSTSAILIYWVTANTISTMQVGLLKIPAVRKVLKLPPRIPRSQKKKTKSEGFIQELKSTWENMKTNKKLRENEDVFREAGRGPIQKTYVYDPTRTVKVLEKK